ncbi:MAG: hypothetical protein H8E66_05230 [Planctomycetes bacterium]|nr:hypothetical protein [Planctomycetota bacterium]
MRNLVATLALIPLALCVGIPASHQLAARISSIFLSERTGQLHVAVIPTVQRPVVTGHTKTDPLVGPLVSVNTLPETTSPRSPAFNLGTRALFHPHGAQVCASGCAASQHPTETLTATRLQSLLRDFSEEPIAGPGPAQDELLYFGRQASRLLAAEGYRPLDSVRTAILKQELARDHAEIEIRVVDSTGTIRASLPCTRVPLDRRHEFVLDTLDVQPMIASGTVKRVGRDYVWTRL